LLWGGYNLKRQFFLLLSTMGLILSLSLFGCSSGGSSATGSSSNGSSGKLNVKFSTATTTGVYYPLGAALAKLWNDNVSGVKVASQASDGSVQNMNLMSQGKVNMALATTGVLYNAYNGKGKFEGRGFQDVRAVAALYPGVTHMVAREGIGVDSIEDFKGKSFVPGAPGSATRGMANKLFEAYGMTFKDVEAQFVGFTQASQLMRDGKIAGAAVNAGLPASAIVEMVSTGDGKLINLTDEAISQLSEKYPWFFKYTIPAGTYDEQEEDVVTFAVGNVLIVSKDMPKEKVYELTKTMWENLKTVQNTIAATEYMKLEMATTGLAGVPLHPGAKKYYKEQGVFKK
jgi:TRAP transporter TAXI family solute receptor